MPNNRKLKKNRGGKWMGLLHFINSNYPVGSKTNYNTEEVLKNMIDSIPTEWKLKGEIIGSGLIPVNNK